jgi:CspA family cold shock protein
LRLAASGKIEENSLASFGFLPYRSKNDRRKAMQFGTVKKWDAAKGFGFIVSDDDDELFVHKSDLDATVPNKQLKVGQRVAFDIVREMKGDRAVRVKVAR